MNKKDIIRDQKLVIRMSKEEKKLYEEYAKNLGLVPTRLARNILLDESIKKSFITKGIEKATILAYRMYAKKTNDKEAIERFKNYDKWYKAETEEEKEEIEKEIDEQIYK